MGRPVDAVDCYQRALVLFRDVGDLHVRARP